MGFAAAVVVAASCAVILWFKVLRPVQGDIEWQEQGERLQHRANRRLARQIRRTAPR